MTTETPIPVATATPAAPTSNPFVAGAEAAVSTAEKTVAADVSNVEKVVVADASAAAKAAGAEAATVVKDVKADAVTFVKSAEGNPIVAIAFACFGVVIGFVLGHIH